MTEFQHQRHKPPIELQRPRELIVACPEMRSGVNVSRMVRVAGCCGVTRMIVCGNVKIDATIARDAAEQVEIVRRRSSPHALKELSGDGYQLVGLEQTTNSINIHEFQFSRKTVLVVGHERTGLPDEVLRILDHVVEIPVWGLPYSYNAATAVTMALYEYCRQFPRG